MATHRIKSWLVLAAATVSALAAGQRAQAWNGTGHEIIAWIAWQNLSPAARDQISQLLRQHPDYTDMLTHPDTPEGPDRDMEAFVIAATWPDLVRTPGKPQYRYNHPAWHYVDFPYVLGDLPKPADPDGQWKPGTDPANAIQAYQKSLAEIKDASLPPADRAMALCWIEHLVGDIHQPLHAVSLFSATFPTGDKGGNSQIVTVGGKATNLHALWDDMLGTDQNPVAVRTLAQRLMKEFPKADLQEPLQQMDFTAWARESLSAAKETVYLNGKLTTITSDAHNKDKSLPAPELPAGYLAKATAVADQRAALAGYRLAGLLDGVFGK